MYADENDDPYFPHTAKLDPLLIHLIQQQIGSLTRDRWLILSVAKITFEAGARGTGGYHHKNIM